MAHERKGGGVADPWMGLDPDRFREVLPPSPRQIAFVPRGPPFLVANAFKAMMN
jgi:hypothetical protein